MVETVAAILLLVCFDHSLAKCTSTVGSVRQFYLCFLSFVLIVQPLRLSSENGRGLLSGIQDIFLQNDNLKLQKISSQQAKRAA